MDCIIPWIIYDQWIDKIGETVAEKTGNVARKMKTILFVWLYANCLVKRTGLAAFKGPERKCKENFQPPHCY
jgi:hypothetical protein